MHNEFLVQWKHTIPSAACKVTCYVVIYCNAVNFDCIFFYENVQPDFILNFITKFSSICLSLPIWLRNSTSYLDWPYSRQEVFIQPYREGSHCSNAEFQHLNIEVSYANMLQHPKTRIFYLRLLIHPGVFLDAINWWEDNVPGWLSQS